MLQLGLGAVRRRRADLLDVQGVGRVQNRQTGPEPNGMRIVAGAGDQFPEGRHRVGGQRSDGGSEPLPMNELGPVQSSHELGRDHHVGRTLEAS